MKTVGFHPEHIPAQLKLDGLWCVWRAFPKKAKRGWDKIPMRSPQDGVSTAEPEQWLTYDEALTLYEGGGFKGLGLLCEQGYVCIDLDHCVADGVLEPWAQELVDYLHSYTELSPSGTGVRVVLEGTAPRDLGWSEDRQVELYAGHSARFVTVTGKQLNGELTEFTPEKQAWLFDRHAGAEVKHELATPVPGYPPPEELPEVFEADIEHVLTAPDRSYALAAFLKASSYTDDEALGSAWSTSIESARITARPGRKSSSISGATTCRPRALPGRATRWTSMSSRPRRKGARESLRRSWRA